MVELTLKPCPWPHKVERGPYIEVVEAKFEEAAHAGCADCGAFGPCVNLWDYETHEEAKLAAVNLWNARTDTTPPSSAREAVETAQPVAWRYRYVYDGKPARWTLRSTPMPASDATPGFAAVEVEPLYNDAAIAAWNARIDTPPSSSDGDYGFVDEFAGNDRKLLGAIDALLKLDAAGALVPHGIGGHARKLLNAAGSRLQITRQMMLNMRENIRAEMRGPTRRIPSKRAPNTGDA